MTVKTNRLENLTGDKGLETAKIVEGCAKVWAHFNGATSSLEGSINVSSFVDRGVGQYTLNFVNAFTSNKYAATSQCNRVSNGNWWLRTITESQASGSLNPEVETVEPSYATKADPTLYTVIAQGDLA